jgi:hypothetical protein
LNLRNYSDPKILGKIQRLNDEYDSDDFVENRTETYNLSKGKKIYICLRDESGGFFSINTLMFVVIHELAHIVTKRWDIGKKHSPEFWRNNIWLLQEAIQTGVYIPVNYKLKPIKYCNVNINASPLY